MKRQAANRSSFGKSPEDENFLAQLNATLAPHEESGYTEDLDEPFPTVNVIGVPRSGTTLLTQLLCQHTSIQYIDNLAASFWRAPLVGIRLSKKLLERREPIDFESEYGRTSRLSEPHEFGYFWKDILGYQDLAEPSSPHNVDWGRYRLVLTNMLKAADGPLLFKPFLLSMHIAEVLKVLPKTCFVHIKRDPVENALSLIKMRRNFMGDINLWASMKPKNYEELRQKPVAEQVAGQVYHLEKMMEQNMALAPQANTLELSYDELCQNPGSCVQRIIEMINLHSCSVEKISDPPKHFTPKVSQDPLRQDVENAVKKLFG